MHRDGCTLPTLELNRMSLKGRTLLLATLFPSAGPAAAQDSRNDLLRRLNAERQRERAPALGLRQPLNEVAQRHAEEMARSGELRLPPRSEQQIDGRMRQAGYNAH